MAKVNSIISGIHIKYLREYFSSILAQSDDDYYDEQILVRLIPMTDVVHGCLTLPRTEIVFEGEAEAVERHMHLYRMAFLSAGG